MATTCLLLFLFQKIIWLVLPVLLSLMAYYGLRPALDALVLRGLRHNSAAKCVWILLQLLTAALVLATALLIMAKGAAWQSNLDRYLTGGQNLLKQTAGSLEKVVPMFERMKLAS